MNSTYRLCLTADMLYACDGKWWDANGGAAEFQGEKWTQDADAATRYGLRQVKGKHGEGLSLDPAFIHFGGNSGFQALNIAVHAGAKRVIFVGLDCSGSHWHGQHGDGLPNPSEHNFGHWRRAFAAAANQLRGKVEVVNCSIKTTLECFPRAPLGDVL